MPARLMIIGLDGADGRSLDRATADGTLPNLAALRRRGRGWRLSPGPGTTDDSLWASFQYGVDLGEHGRSTYLLEDDHGQRTYAPHREVDKEIFWDRLSSAGHSVAILDVPKCRQPRPLNGIHLTDWLVHGRYSTTAQSYPAALADEVLACFGAPPPSRCNYSYQDRIDAEAVAEVHGNLLRSIGMKRDAGLYFLAQAPWDLFVIGFKEAHCANHMLWHVSDPTHRHHDPVRAEGLGDPTLDILKAQDQAIGELIAEAGPDAEILVFATSDFAPNGSLMHLIDSIVARINDALAAETDGWLVTRLRRLLRRPRKICRSVFRSDDAGAIRVPRRSSDSDESHLARVRNVAAMACELVDAGDGSPVIAAVSHPAFEETGPQAAELPHILLHYRTNICPAAVTSPRLGRISAPVPIIRAGNHAPGGFVLAAGRWAEVAAREVKTTTDFAPLATRILGERPSLA